MFHGQERYDQNPDAHHGHAHDDHHHGHDAKPHESPWVVTLPLVLLAIPSVVIGAIALMPMLFGDFFNGVIFVDGSKHPAMAELAQADSRLGTDGPARVFLRRPSGWLWLGLWCPMCSMVKPEIPAAIMAFIQDRPVPGAGRQVRRGLGVRKHLARGAQCFRHGVRGGLVTRR